MTRQREPRLATRPAKYFCRAWVVLLLACASVGAAALQCTPLRPRATPLTDTAYTQGLLWQIRGPADQRSFLFGTIHLSAAMTGQPNATVTKALLASHQFGMEVLLDADAMLQIGARMRLSNASTLRKQVDAELYARTVELLAAYGVSSDDADRLKPWAAYTTLSLPPGQNGMPLDLVLLATARKTTRHQFGLETLAEQTAVFESLSHADQTALLTESVCHYKVLQRDTQGLVDYYAKGDLAGLYRAANKYTSAINERLLKALVVDRNQRMIERMQPYLAQGDAFIAIGALHLPGAKGLLAQLAARGYRVSPVAGK